MNFQIEDILMNILKKQYQVNRLISRKTRKIGIREFETDEKQTIYYTIGYYFLGLKVWRKTVWVEEIPTHVWILWAFLGNCDWRDGFYTKYPLFAKLFITNKTVSLI